MHGSFLKLLLGETENFVSFFKRGWHSTQKEVSHLTTEEQLPRHSGEDASRKCARAIL